MLPWILLLAAFAPTLVWVGEGWILPGSYFQHGPLLVAAGLVALHSRRSLWHATPRSPFAKGWVLLLLILLGHLGAQALMVDSFSGLLLLPAIFALLWAQHGRQRVRVLAAPIGCFFFAIPLPLFVSGRLAFQMRQWATDAAVWLGNLFDMGLRAEGTRIWVPGQAESLWVGSECSGLRSLTALLALGYLFAVFLSARRLHWRLVFVALAAGVALLLNFVRITVLAAIAARHGTEFASGTAHDVSGHAIYVIAILLLIGIDRLLPRERRARDTSAELAAPMPAAETGAARALLLTILLVGLPAAVLGFVRPVDAAGELASRFPRALGEFHVERDHALREHDFELLGTRDVVWRRYRSEPARADVDVAVVFHGRNWKSLHPPEICLEAAGLELIGEERRSVALGEVPVELTLLRARRGGQAYLVGYLFGGKGYETASFLGFFWHNVPRAILRRPTAGYLLRVEVLLADPQGGAAGERILSRFLQRALPVLRDLVNAA